MGRFHRHDDAATGQGLDEWCAWLKTRHAERLAEGAISN